MAKVSLNNDRHFENLPETSILESARHAGLVLDHSCRNGRCGQCKAHLLSGTTRPIRSEECLTAEEAGRGIILTCTRAAIDDVELDIADLGLPADIQAKILPCRISSIEPLAADVVRVVLRLPPTAAFRYLPGQYIDVIASAQLRRSYSIANAKATAGIELHIRRVEGGRMSDYWFNRAKPNDLLRLEGPLGTFFLREIANQDLVFLATGTGFAPIKGMLESLTAGHGARRILLFWGGRSGDDHYQELDFGDLPVECHSVVSRAQPGPGQIQGYVQNAVLQKLSDLADATVYACGSPAMIESAQAALEAAGLPKRRFFSDAFVSSDAQTG